MRVPFLVWFFLGMWVLGMIARAWLNSTKKKSFSRADELASSGWEGASRLYKQMILERTNELDLVDETIEKLEQLYADNQVVADLAPLRACVDILHEIQASGASDRKKNKLSVEVHPALLKAVDALPPALDVTIHPVDATCGFCPQRVAGQAIGHQAYLRKGHLTREQVIGHVCPACQIPSHKECATSGIKFSTWSGYESCRCAKCGASAAEPMMIFGESAEV